LLTLALRAAAMLHGTSEGLPNGEARIGRPSSNGQKAFQAIK
jgi:hypothetical protein